MTIKKIDPAEKIRGQLVVSGDKSISHRALMLSAIAQGTSTLHGLSNAEDVSCTADCMRHLGIHIENDGFATIVHGKGLQGLSAPSQVLDAGNSGTTIRLLAGILAGQPFTTKIDGDASLRARPMNRIIKPLAAMGARITGKDDGFAPLVIEGTALKALHYDMPMASAQVKSAIMLAALFASGETTIKQPAQTRDHTERMLRCMNVPVVVEKGLVRITQQQPVAGHLSIPGDFSSAIFFMAAAFMLPDSELMIHNIGLNPTRSYALKLLSRAGANLAIENMAVKNGEETANMAFSTSALTAFHAKGPEIPFIIDEIPILAVMATQAEGTSSIREAAELRVKESDRIHTIATNLKKMGATVREFEDGLEIDGPVKLQGAEIDSFGDHRIAMAFAIAGLIAEGSTTIQNADAASVSFPDFFTTLEGLI